MRGNESTHGVLFQLVSESRSHRSELRKKVAVLCGEGILFVSRPLELLLEALHGVEILGVIVVGVAVGGFEAVHGWRRGEHAFGFLRLTRRKTIAAGHVGERGGGHGAGLK